ncbi:guanylate-binding protein [Dictyocaulus viviparus]|uniref:Guanylate-binding protein n=1 Tax=Dictyocaulus viviparus TaxID=29172 RepID=A0A0D8Y950_DICVI|nr:guanylate-binding protein [Dictyocaulus viviparus]
MGETFSEGDSFNLKSEDEQHEMVTYGPHPVRIVDVVEDVDHSFELNVCALEKILLDPKVADKKVAVIGVAGAYRMGKSFLLNFFLRYLQWRTDESDDDCFGGMDWLSVSADSLKGFSWRGGSKRDTNGILIWSEPFIMKDKNGEEIAVILMDTQGTFDSQSTVKDCATIFALSTMVSSMQIYNLLHNIQEDHLQHLQMFTEYGRLALEDNESKPFQSLQFLVRDWSFPYEAEFGYQGGQRILDERLRVSAKQHPELQQLRQHIRSCFENISCFLMPYPGIKVATNPDFSGSLSDIAPEFQQQLRVMVPRILDSRNLAMKEINGHKVTCRELVEYFKSYMKIFQGQDLPEPKSMLMASSPFHFSATAEANNLAAVASARALYQREMEEICGGDTPYMSTNELIEQHKICKNEAIREFRNARKMGGVEYSLQFLRKLEEDIEESYDSYLKMNNGKNLFKSMRTPAVLVSLMIIDYICQEFCQMIGLDIFAGIFSSILVIVIGALTLWAYARYSGTLREASGWVDDAVTFLWTNFISPNAGQLGAFGGAIQLGEKFANSTTPTSNPMRERKKK